MTTARPWLAAYDSSIRPDLDIEDVTLSEGLSRSARNHPGATAIRFKGRAFSYRWLDGAVSRFANGLRGLGVKPGERVAIQLPNVPQAVIAFYGTMRAGATAVMTNPLYTLRELEHQWADADCKVAVTCDFTWMGTLREHRAVLRPEKYVVASIPEYLGIPKRWLAPFVLGRQDPPRYARFPDEPGVARFKRMVDASPAGGEFGRPDFDDVAILQYTGGTTGPSKGAMLTHRNLSANVQQIDAWFVGAREAHEVMLTALPLFHVFGLTVCMNWGVWSAAELVLEPNPRDIGSLVDAIEGARVTLFPSVPALFAKMCEYEGIEKRDLRSVRACFSGSAPISPETMRRFEELTGARVVEGFGMTETSPVTHCNPLGGERKVGSVGVPISNTGARVVDVDTGTTDVAPGEEGELIVRGPQVMAGYWNRPDETAQVLRDGWMHTGDLATMDDEGFFRIVGRKKDMINVSGLKVFPDEVDHVLASHPDVLEAATIGVPREKGGEQVKSFVVLRKGSKATAETLEAFCRESLAAYKVPKEIEFLDELPKSTIMKVLRRELRDIEMAKRKKS
ncbi:MAG: long-chain fatty acid--CoA ligase [Planctomycetota bacterium]